MFVKKSSSCDIFCRSCCSWQFESTFSSKLWEYSFPGQMALAIQRGNKEGTDIKECASRRKSSQGGEKRKERRLSEWGPPWGFLPAATSDPKGWAGDTYLHCNSLPAGLSRAHKEKSTWAYLMLLEGGGIAFTGRLWSLRHLIRVMMRNGPGVYGGLNASRKYVWRLKGSQMRMKA